MMKPPLDMYVFVYNDPSGEDRIVMLGEYKQGTALPLVFFGHNRELILKTYEKKIQDICNKSKCTIMLKKYIYSNIEKTYEKGPLES